MRRCGLWSSRLSCRRAVRLSSSACLMFAAVCLDTIAPAISSLHLIAHAWLRSASCVPRLVPLTASPCNRCRCLCCCRPIASRYPPRFIDTPGGTIRRGCGGGSLGSACLPIGTPSHPFGSASDGDGARVLATLDYPCLFLPHGHHRCRLLLARSLNPISSSSCRLIASLPDYSTRGTGRWSICAGFVYCGGGGCLACLGVVLFILSMGDVVARRFVSGL